MNTVSPLVSVCVPVCDNADTIGKTLDALLGQTYPRLEIIISDNGSFDDGRRIARTFARDNFAAGQERARHLWYCRLEHTVSQNESWRYALRFAKGEFVILHAADDFTLEPDFIEKMAAPLTADPSVMFSVCPTRIVPAEGFDPKMAELMVLVHKTIERNCKDVLACDDPRTKAGKILFNSMENRVGTPYNALVRREALPWSHWKKTRNYWPESYADWDFMLRLFLNHKGAWVPDTHLDYHLDESGGFYKICKKDARLTLVDKMYRFMMPVTVLCDPLLKELRDAAGPDTIERLKGLAMGRLGEAVDAAKEVTA